MPTRLPTRRNLLRRYTPDLETKRNLVATFGEFGLALAFVTVTVLVIALIERGGFPFAQPPQAPMTVFGP